MRLERLGEARETFAEATMLTESDVECAYLRSRIDELNERLRVQSGHGLT